MVTPKAPPSPTFRSNRERQREQFRNEFGTALNKLLNQKALTQRDLAVRLGTSHPYLNMTMSGTRIASPWWVDRVSDALDLSPPVRSSLHKAAARDYGYKIDLGQTKKTKGS